MWTKQLHLPTAEPITRAFAKNFCKIPAAVTQDDELFDLLISSARTYAENATNLSLVPKQYVLFLDEFPSFPFIGGAYAPLFGSFPFYFGAGPVTNFPTASPLQETERLPYVIPLSHSPVIDVTKIIYIDQAGDEVTLNPGADFVVDLGTEPARVGPIPGGRWPIGIVALSSVQVYYSAGYDVDPTAITDKTYTGTSQTNNFKFASGIPADLKVAMLMLVADAYANREPNVSGAVGRVPTVDNILMANRAWDYSPAKG
jgi:hypothetical protein